MLVAASGGPDSTALLAGLAELRERHGFTLVAGHVDHGLRGPEGAAEGDAVEALGARLGVRVRRERLALTAGPDLEARARRARYAALRRMADAAGAQWITTGHTLDDQAETVLLRLLRGTGRRGLGGMRRVRGRLFRPLLGATRADVRRYLAERDLPWAVDRSNADLAHTRNRVRLLLLPFLKAEFNPRLRAALADVAARLADEDALLDAMAGARLEALAAGGALAVDVAREPAAIARRVVARWLAAGTGRTPSARHVAAVLALAAAAAPGTAAVAGAARVVREGTRLVVRPGREAAVEPFEFSIALGMAVEHPRRLWRLALGTPRDRRPGEERAPDALHALFDADLLPAVLTARPPRPGDRVRLFGGGTRKVQDVLVDAKVPREARPTVPLLVADGEVLWVAGVLRGAGAALSATTRRVVDGVYEPAI